MGIIKTLRHNWVDEFIPYSNGNPGSLDPSTYGNSKLLVFWTTLKSQLTLTTAHGWDVSS